MSNTQLSLNIQGMSIPPDGVQQTPQKTPSVAVEIFKEVISPIFHIAPLFFHRIISFKILGALGSSLSIAVLGGQLQNSSSCLEKVAITIQILASVAGIITFFYSGGILSYLTIEALLVASSAIGNVKVFCENMHQLKELYRSNGPKQSCFRTVMKIIKITISLIGVSLSTLSTVRHSYQLMKGFSAWKTLDSVQQSFVLKHRVLHTLADRKPLKAVIIDGLSSKWGRKSDDLPAASAQWVYENAETRTYHVSSSQDFYNTLQQTSQELGGIDLLLIQGHGDELAMNLGENYTLQYVATETEAMNRFLKKGAHVYLFGCNTASPPETRLDSLTEYIASRLKDKTVVGFKAFVNPFFCSFSKAKMAIESHFPISKGFRWSGFFNAKTITV